MVHPRCVSSVWIFLDLFYVLWISILQFNSISRLQGRLFYKKGRVFPHSLESFLLHPVVVLSGLEDYVVVVVPAYRVETPAGFLEDDLLPGRLHVLVHIEGVDTQVVGIIP
jgi:hypothetical protein